jgi:hypothetical protein
MTKPIVIFSSLFFFYISSLAQDKSIENLLNGVSDTSLKANLYKITGAAFEGRMAASPGDQLAIQYIADWFAAHHLKRPYQSPTPFLQSIPLTKTDYRNSSLAAGNQAYEQGKDWIYYPVEKALAAHSAEVVFVGYGFSVPGYDELKEVNIEAKLVLFELIDPSNTAGKPLFARISIPDQGTLMNTISSKKPLGALLYVDAPMPAITRSVETTSAFFPYRDMHDPKDSLVPGAVISKELAENIVGGPIDSIFDLINRSGEPHSFNTHKQLTLSIVANREPHQSANIVGIIYGTDTSLPGIVLTAHHDHEGIVNGMTYYGADDNGTGVTALLEIVKVLGDAAASGIRPKRTIIFISTAAEEQGEIGSTYYAAHPVLPLAKTYCSLNIDMLGRVDSFYAGKRPDSNYIYVISKDPSGKTLNSEKLKSIDEACCQLSLDTLYNPKSGNPSDYGLLDRSDNLSFIKEGIPAIWFFSGFHKDYHQPTDTPDKINFPLLKKRTQFVLATLWHLANEQ